MDVVRVSIHWHPGLSIYASEAFLKCTGDEYGWLGGIDGSGKLRCILPYTIIQKAFVRMVRFRVETISLVERLDIEEERAFLNSAVRYFRSIKCDMIIPATTNTIFRTYPDAAIAVPYGTYIIDLTQPEDQLWKNLNDKCRRKVVRARDAGINIHSGLEYLEFLYEIIKDTLKRSDLHFMTFRAFRNLALGIKEHILILVAERDGIVMGGTVFPFSSYGAYALYGGRVSQSPPGAMNLLKWEAIKRFREMGVKRLDFVGVRINPTPGSKHEGLAAFKRSFGGCLVQGYLWKYPINRIKYAAYGLAVRLLKGGDIVDQERHRLAQ